MPGAADAFHSALAAIGAADRPSPWEHTLTPTPWESTMETGCVVADTWEPDAPDTKYWAVFEGEGGGRYRLDLAALPRAGWFSLDSRPGDRIRVPADPGARVGLRVEAVCAKLGGGELVREVVAGGAEVPAELGFMGAPGFACVPSTAPDGSAAAMAFFHVLRVQPAGAPAEEAAPRVVALHLTARLDDF